MTGVYKIGYSAKKVDTLRVWREGKETWESYFYSHGATPSGEVIRYKIGIFRNKYAYGGSLISSDQVYSFEVDESDETINEKVESALSMIKSQYDAQDAAEIQQGQDEYSDVRDEQSYQTSQNRSKEQWWTSQAQSQASNDISNHTTENGTYGSKWNAAKSKLRSQYGI